MATEAHNPEAQPKHVQQEIKYLSDLTGFRRIISQNVADADEAEPPSPWQFLYFIDSNVLRLCFDPHSEAEHTRLFRFLAHRPEFEAGVSIITAQFLLGGRLPGRRRAPLFVTPSHWSEFAQHYSKMISDLAALRSRMKDSAEVDLKSRVLKIRNRISEAGSRVGELRRIYDSDIQELYTDSDLDLYARPKMLAQLLKSKDLIRPLLQAPYINTALISQTDSERLEFWTDRLTESRKRGQHNYKNTDNIDADAQSIYQIEALNLDFEKRGIPVKAILITADRSILDSTIRSPDSAKFNFVRNVKQFVPLINSRDLTGDDAFQGLTEDVKLAIDAFLQQNMPDKAQYNEWDDQTQIELDLGVRSLSQQISAVANASHSATHDRRTIEALIAFFEKKAQEKYGGLLGNSLSNMLEEISEKWMELLSTVFKMHSGVISKYYSDWLNEITDTFEELDSSAYRQVALERNRESIDVAHDLTRLHLERTLISELFSIGVSTAKWGRLPFGLQIGPPENTKNEIERVAKLIVDGATNDTWESVQVQATNLCNLEADHPAYIAHACAAISLQLGRLQAAQNFSSFCEGLIEAENSSGSLELVYHRCRVLKVTSTRFLYLQSKIRRPNGKNEFKISHLTAACSDAFDFLVAHGMEVEAALVKSEASAVIATQLLSDFFSASVTPAHLAAERLRRVVADASVAIDIAERHRDDSSQGIGNGLVVDIAETRASAALIFGMIAVDLQGLEVPSLAHSYIDSAKRILRRHQNPSKGGQRFAEPLSLIAGYFGNGKNGFELASLAEKSSIEQALADTQTSSLGHFEMEREIIRIFFENKCER